MPFNTAFLKKHALFIAGMALFLFVFFKNAWVADDAYIAFRSIEQFFAGNGLRWNVDERVQVYTSPLWFGLQIVLRMFSHDLFLNAILLSAACCVLALWFARKTINNDSTWLVFVLLASGMWAVMDFSSSGLENPLLYLLLAVFLRYLFAYDKADSEYLKQLCFNRLLWTLGLLSITRHDMATLVAIPALYVLARASKERGAVYIVRNSYRVWLPLLLWSIFSVIYYGVPFPNTAYAKMLHGIPRSELMDFGSLYLQVSFRFDAFAMLAVGLLTLRMLWKRELVIVAVWLGVMLNLYYIVAVGGDFMIGRFISEAVFVSALALCSPMLITTGGTRWLPAAAVVLFAWMLAAASPLKLAPDSGFDISEGRRHYSWNGILNERNFYFKTNSLWAWLHRQDGESFPVHKWCQMGVHAVAAGKQVSDFGGIGMYGYCAGLQLIVIDNLALGEPFLARLPKPVDRPWRAGHFHRDYPQGYYESRMSGKNLLVDPQLARLWDDVALATRAGLFSAGRWQAIWRLNSGYYTNIGPVYFADIAQKNP